MRKYLQLDDAAIEVSITPNRGDCLSIAGMAREVSAITHTPVTPPKNGQVKNDTVKHSVNVQLKAPEDCPHYVGRVIQNINNKFQHPFIS